MEEVQIQDRRCTECSRMNLECAPSTASRGNRLKCEACRRRKVACRFPLGFPFDQPNPQPLPPLPNRPPTIRRRRSTIRHPVSPEIEEVPAPSNEESRPRRARLPVDYRIPPLLATPEVEEFISELFVIVKDILNFFF